MKTSSVSLTLLIAMLLAVPAFVRAEAPAAAKTPAKEEKEARPSGSGDIGSMSEESAATPEDRYRQEMIRRFDKNGDGRLDAAELKEAEKARALLEKNGGVDKFRQLVLKRFDKNGDGRLDEAERAEAAKFRAEQIKKFDKDGDGQLNDAEKAEALKAFMAEEHATPAAKPTRAPAPGK